MKSLKLWSLVVALALGNLMGCSRVPAKSLDASDGILAGQERYFVSKRLVFREHVHRALLHATAE